MSDEDLRRAIDFLAEQQSLYAAKLERDQPRLARLEEAFLILVQLAQLTDERMDDFSETMSTLSRTIDDQVKRMIELAEAQAHANKKIAELAESQAHADRKIAELAEAQTWATRKLAELAEAQMRTDARVNRLSD